MNNGEYSKVISLLENSINISENLSNYQILAECYRCEGRKEALPYYKKALEYDNGKNHIHILHQMGLCYIYIENNLKMALETFLEIEDKKPTFLVYYIIGYCYYEFNQLNKALLYANKSFAIKETKEVVLLITYCLSEMRKVEECRKFLNDMAKKHPDYYLSVLSAGNLAERDKLKESFIISSMPKSGTVYICSILSSLLKYPLFNLQLLHKEGVSQNLIQYIAGGGVMGNGHISPETFGFEYFRKHSFNKFIVHTRDPRQTAVSWFYFLEKVRGNYGARPIIKQMVPDSYFSWNINKKKEYLLFNLFEQWYSMPASWYNYHIDNPDVNILFTSFEKMKNDRAEFFLQIIEFIDASYPNIDFELEPEIARNHHRKGSLDEWRGFWSAEQKKVMNEIINQAVGAFFKWEGF